MTSALPSSAFPAALRSVESGTVPTAALAVSVSPAFADYAVAHSTEWAALLSSPYIMWSCILYDRVALLEWARSRHCDDARSTDPFLTLLAAKYGALACMKALVADGVPLDKNAATEAAYNEQDGMTQWLVVRGGVVDRAAIEKLHALGLYASDIEFEMLPCP
jgi:hypothetical protein